MLQESLDNERDAIEGELKSANGTCLIVGMPGTDRKDEPISVDLVRSVLYATQATSFFPKRPRRSTRIEIFGAIPHQLMGIGSSGVSVGSMIQRTFLGKEHADKDSDGTEADEANILRDVERQRAAVIHAIANMFSIPKTELEVVTLTDKLRDRNAYRGFVDGFSNARTHLGELLTMRTGNVVLMQALIDLIPEGVRRDTDKETLDRLVNYALAEILLLIRKITKEVVVYFYKRECKYLDVVKAYMSQIQHFPAEDEKLVDRFIRMPPEIDGLRLPKLPPCAAALKPNLTLRNKSCAPYRVGPHEEQRRVLLYPPDSYENFRKKLSRPDVPEVARLEWERVRDEYIAQMLIPTLDLARRTIEAHGPIRGMARRMLDQVLPPNILDPKNIGFNLESILKTFYDVILEPLADEIRKKLEELKETVGDSTPLMQAVDVSNGSGGEHSDQTVTPMPMQETVVADDAGKQQG